MVNAVCLNAVTTSFFSKNETGKSSGKKGQCRSKAAAKMLENDGRYRQGARKGG